MSNYQELIRDMPSIPAHKKMASDMSGAMMNVIFKKISDDLAKINKSLEEYKHPIIKIPEMPTDLEVKLSDQDIAKLSRKDLFPKSVSVNNLKDLNVKVDLAEIARSIESLKGYLNSLKSNEVRVSNLSDLIIPAQEVKIDTKEFAKLDLLPELIREVRELVNKAEGSSSAVAIPQTPGNAVRATGVNGVLALSNTTPTRITATSTEITRVDISVTNGPVAVGFDSNVNATSGSENGVLLYPGNLPHSIYVRNLNLIYFAGASGRRVCYNYYA